MPALAPLKFVLGRLAVEWAVYLSGKTSTRSVQLERSRRAFQCFSVANRAAKSYS